MTFAFFLESVGGGEWLVLLAVILVVVGPKNLPAAARKIGQIMGQLRRAADEFKRQLMTMDQEVTHAVDEVKKDYIETPVNDAVNGETSKDAATASSADEPAYDENSPYPGYDYYDETQYQEGEGDASATCGESPAAAVETPAPAAAPEGAAGDAPAENPASTGVNKDEDSSAH